MCFVKWNIYIYIYIYVCMYVCMYVCIKKIKDSSIYLYIWVFLICIFVLIFEKILKFIFLKITFYLYIWYVILYVTGIFMDTDICWSYECSIGSMNTLILDRILRFYALIFSLSADPYLKPPEMMRIMFVYTWNCGWWCDQFCQISGRKDDVKLK